MPAASVADPAAGSGWVATRAFGRAVVVCGTLALIAVLTGRFDLVLLATPFALGTAVSLARRPSALPVVRLWAAEESAAEGAGVVGALSIGNADEVRYDVVVARLRPNPWLRLRDTDRPHAATVRPGRAADLPLHGRALRWGRHPVGPAVVHGVASDGLLVTAPLVASGVPVKVYPVTEPFDAPEAMPRAAGLIGVHRSRRPGEGGELAGVRVFSPGDRLRRIDWRISLRTQQLHVASTLSDRDAEVVLLLDVLHEAGRSGGVDGTPSVLDTTVRAAAGIAEHYLKRGDRVSMVEYSAAPRRVRAGSGRRHYLTILEWLLDVAPGASFAEPGSGAFGPHLLSPNALVIVLTPLLDTRSAGMLAQIARSGRFVVAVDTLTGVSDGADPSAAADEGSRWLPLARRLWLLERDNLVGELREHGVPVVAWAGAGSLDLVLRDVARMAAGPKGALR
ncbi:MAG TPA: DUF58 domain-containing protein [Micromonosporaceae bacterium]|nr:DUF58 domain-containing protein [Micromonosporaceae bacterium]